jgi:hypothetical protein
MWERAQRHRWQWALALVGVLVVGIGIGGVVGHDPPDSVPLTLAPPWDPDLPEPAGSASAAAPPVAPPASPGVPATVAVGQPERTTPPRATTPPVTPLLTVTAGQIPDVVDLSREGTRDWIHWGVTSATSIDRKWGVPATIKDRGSPTGRGRYDNNPQVYSWSGGDPNWAWTGTPTGVYVCGAGTGFVLQVPAGPATRTLRVYAGVWMAKGRLTATLDGAAAVSRTLVNTQAISTSRFEVTFRAAAGARLDLSWTATDVYHPTCGNVDLQAATLS